MNKELLEIIEKNARLTNEDIAVMLSKEEGDRYEAYYDDYLNIVAKQGNADIDLEYDFTEGIVPAAICIPLFLVPVLISSKKLLKKKPYDLLSE